ncbi:uncharacterized protein LOC132624259 [Lycium barbarum]|uniref:uncharacterized protein LOC132624259 n=1 Tax=Lycium barbarum TaxID=112863 RepID=UPI00293F1FC7|nr:uncharacterized protein LOC132624259 [Lycium barbarum]
MEELLEKSTRSTRKATGLRYDDLCIHLDLDLPKGFKISKFEMFNGTGNPKVHLRSYCDQLVGVKKNEPLIMRLFSRSLTNKGMEWFAIQGMCQWLRWEDMAESFMERFRFNNETIPDSYYLEKVKQKSMENYKEFSSRWRAEVARVQPPVNEGELVSVFIRSQELDFYDRILLMAGRPFSELVKIGETIKDGLKSGKIVSTFNKASGQAIAGIFHKKKEDVASISHISNQNPKGPSPSHQASPLLNFSTLPYSLAPLYYTQPTFTTVAPTYLAPPSVRVSAPAYQPLPQQHIPTTTPAKLSPTTK